MGVPGPSVSGRAVVTGATRGIGRALTTELAARGYNLIVTSRSEQALDELAARLSQRYGVIVEVLAADLADPVQRDQLAGELAGREISILCANAGGTGGGAPVGQRAPASGIAEVQLNVFGGYELVQAVLPGMLARRAGGILVSGSVAGNSPIPNFATYAASKAFVNTFTESLHVETQGSGVHVTLLAPGRLRTTSHEREQASLVPGFVWTSAEYAAAMSLEGLARNKMRVVPGLHAKAVSAATGYAPRLIAGKAWRLTRRCR